VTGVSGHGVRLASVLVQVLENILYDVGSHGGSEDGGECDGVSRLVLSVVYGN